MDKIEFFHSIHTPEETNTLGSQLGLIVGTSGSTDANLLKAIEAVRTANAKLTLVINAQKVNPFTEPLKKRDNFRDLTYRGGRDVTDGMTLWVFDTEKQEAAIRLKKIFIRHGWKLYKYAYSDQSAATNAFIEELKTEENQKDLTLLGLMDWFNALVQSQADFEKVFNQMTSHKNGKEQLAKHDAQVPVNNAIGKLVMYINSVVLFNEEDTTWKNIYNDVEGIIKDATTRSRARRSGGGTNTSSEE